MMWLLLAASVFAQLETYKVGSDTVHIVEPGKLSKEEFDLSFASKSVKLVGPPKSDILFKLPMCIVNEKGLCECSAADGAFELTKCDTKNGRRDYNGNCHVVLKYDNCWVGSDRRLPKEKMLSQNYAKDVDALMDPHVAKMVLGYLGTEPPSPKSDSPTPEPMFESSLEMVKEHSDELDANFVIPKSPIDKVVKYKLKFPGGKSTLASCGEDGVTLHLLARYQHKCHPVKATKGLCNVIIVMQELKELYHQVKLNPLYVGAPVCYTAPYDS